MKQILIMMATWNGEKYLREQLDSILGQSHTAWHLVIQDDGSTDRTRAIVKEYCERDGRITLTENSSGVHGAYCNFYSLISRCKSGADFDYYMFCDQDDIWYRDKIEVFLKAMEGYDGTPALAYADMRICDATGTVTLESINDVRRTDQLDAVNAFFIHRVRGCNLMMNRALFRLAPAVDVSRKETAALSHDSLYTKFAVACGSLVYIPEATMNYRRHDENVTLDSYGKTTTWHAIRRIFSPKGLAEAHAKVYNQSLTAIRLMRTLPLTQEQRERLDTIERCIRKGGPAAIAYLNRQHTRLGGTAENLARKTILLIGLHRPFLEK